MGVCLSRCGDAQQQAGVVAATISHQNSLENVEDANHSLKTFLHLYEIAETKRSFSSPRASLGDTLLIPHSSELFSLPDSDVDRSSSCISPSPARTSRASISSRATSSPKSTRHSFSAWGGRFSTDKTISMGCRKKIRPARYSQSFQGDHDLAAHQRFVEAIARLERLNGGKNLGLRGSSFCRSDLETKPQVLPKSRSGEYKRPSNSSSGRHYGQHSRNGRHQAREQSQALELSKSSSHSKKHGTRLDTSHCCSRTNELDLSDRTSDPVTVLIPETFSQPKTMGNLVSMAGPIIKQMPLEKSVTNFLKEVETFVSLIEAPRLSLSSEAALQASLKDPLDHEPLIITTYSRSVDDAEDTDSDEQFTFFEASFEDSDSSQKQEQSRTVVTSLQRLVQSVALEICPKEKPVTCVDVKELVTLPAKTAAENQITSPGSSAVLRIKDGPAGTPEKAALMDTLSIYEDPGIESKPTGKADAARLPLTDIDTNVTSTTKKSPIKLKSPSKMKVPKGFRRGLSRSLDSRDQGSVTKLDFSIFRIGQAQVAPYLSNVNTECPNPTAEAAALSTKLGLLQNSTTSTPEDKSEEPKDEQTEML